MTRVCAICRTALARRPAETSAAWRERRSCSKACGNKLRSSTMAGRPYIPADEGVRPEDQAKVAAAFGGRRFDALTMRATGAVRLPAPMTHVPTGSAASWTSEG